MSSALSAAACVLLSTALWAQESPQFSHRYHLEEEELACEDCHVRVRKSTRAEDHLMPGAAACADCHDPGEVPVDWAAPEPDLRFSHRYHLETLGLECRQCHSGIGSAREASASTMPAMETCMSCHNGSGAPRDCESCHNVPRAELMPPSHQTGWKNTHGRQARITDTSCIPCHALDECQQCHEGALLNRLAGPSIPRQAPLSPTLDNSKGLTLQRVHGLNYRFLHPLEARGKTSDCISCHEVDTGDFCAACHNPGGNPDIRPLWHGGPDWGALAGGVGTGGGRHAELARRDMENCVACHDVQGTDPTCLLCHVDRTPGPGNDPQTHSRSFAGDIGEGEFHDDEGAVCYTCHTRGAAAGVGFCGYCHGPR